MSAVEDVVTKTEELEIDPKGVEPTTGNGANDNENRTKAEEKLAAKGKQPSGSSEGKKEEVALQLEPKSGVSFPVMLDDGKQLSATGLRKKGMFGIGIKVYGFGIYTDSQKLKDLLRSKIETAPTKPTKEMYEMVIHNDVGMTVKMVIVYSYLTVGMVRKSFDDGLGAAIKKLTGGKNDESTKRLMGETSDDTKLPKDSEVEISRLPGNILQTKVMGEVVSTTESEILCRAYAYLYLGDDPFDKESKENFGNFLLSLF